MSRFATIATMAVLMMLFANFMFAVVDTSSKWLLGAGYLAVQLAFFRYAIQFVITSGVLAGLRGRGLGAALPLLPVLGLRASLLVVSTIFNFVALQSLSLTVASAIMFSAPIIVCALSWPLLGERVGRVRWAAVALGFAGVLVVIRPFGEALDPAAFLMLLAATGLALYSILTRKLSRDVKPLIMQFLLGLTGTVALLPFCWVYWIAPASAFDLVLMVSLGLFAWIGHEFLIRAHRIAEANYLMPYSYSYLIYMMAGGFVVFGDLPDAWTMLGALMIAMSGLLIWRREVALMRAGDAGGRVQ
ncbi:MAG: DMT family transporter [Boseongicola sp. SB0670_bin_30]|nr:DMT family transporter [Boseongicola sp. SB0670_bin_30]